ncbi:sugar phosphate isomerase/epimerase [Microlunatus sp. Gsoil 973]|uniref:sugar phosphate isomerase/epimerase family protein n=1 Tax=Microlunatus sp. Gsoil 973 TaxID=2672569 RepID=UPI0012B4BCDB|nr:TIM barrel protein [Microlunatus sp. Gsoil 973]QGN32244.1 TIM barrel protein [Microlunatus sp. Gsoil 973]
MDSASATTIWAVFTKPWRTVPAADLAELVVRMGFNAVEFPLRPGYQVDLDRLDRSLAELVAVFADHGVSIASVASAPDDHILAACAANGIDLLRIMIPVEAAGYLATADSIRRRLDDLVSLSHRHGVRIGIQPHYDDYIADSSELAVLIKDYDPAAIVAIWDAAHDGLARKHPANTLPLLWDRLAMVNFKNACYRRTDVPGRERPDWSITFVKGSEGLCSWAEAAAVLRERRYAGPICLPAEYTDERDLEAKVAADLGYLRVLLSGEEDRT